MVALLCFSCALSASNGAAQQTMFPEWMGREVEVLSGVRQGVIEDRQALFDAGCLRQSRQRSSDTSQQYP